MFHWTFPSILFFTLASLCSCNEQFLVVAPNLIRTDMEENVFLQASGVSGIIPVTITITDFTTAAELTKHYANLNAENNFHTLASVKVPSVLLRREEKAKKFVNMEVKFGEMHTEKRVILVSFQAGYIFIQTNKPIYKPEEIVEIRAYVSSTTFKASVENSVSIDIKNTDEIVIHQTHNTKPKHGIVNALYTLPKIVTEGKWTIVARFDHWPQNNFNTTFEVKKYVLPAFGVTVKPRKPYMDVDDTQIFVDITARYLYNQPVIGTAYVNFGLKNGKQIRKSPKVKEVAMLQSGGTLNFTMDEIRQACEVQTSNERSDCSVESLVGSFVYMKLTVLTKSGGDLVEVENSNIKIVKSPFVLTLNAMAKYFHPNFPFYFTVNVNYHDGTPANNIPLTTYVQGRSQTSRSGVSTSININQASPQKIIVTTIQPGLSDDRQARKEFNVEPYKPQNPSQPNYLYIHKRSDADLTEIPIEMSISSNRQGNIKEATYLVLSKGKILEAKRVPVSEQQVTSVTISVTQKMMPTFRFVAFYQIGTEVVSDSIKLQVTKTCVHPPTISVENAEPGGFSPGQKLQLNIKGEPSARIGLVAVDQAVYLLSKNRFNQKHILNEVDSRDIGCTHGSGKDAMGVFSDAGLLFARKGGPSTESRQELKCQDNGRRRRSTVVREDQAQILKKFQEKSLQRCCRDGLRGLLMPYSCEQRSLYITEGLDCVNAFLKCCNVYKNKVNTQGPDDEGLGRNRGRGSSSDTGADENDALSNLGNDDDEEEEEEEEEEEQKEIPIEKIYLRSQFKDSWLWRDVELPKEPDLDGSATSPLETAIPDSITQWSILAVSSSMTTGFCVGAPLPLVVWRKFFVDLKLPYSVTRKEQVEIQAVVYNYDPTRPVDVTVILMKTSKMCSMAFKRRHTQTVTVAPKSSAVVRYTIVPFEAGQIPIQVVASVLNAYNDRIEKKLNVVIEGVEKAEHRTFYLNPAEHEGEQIVEAYKPILKGVVPKSEPVTKIKILGNILSESIENAIHDDPLAKLIRMPGGCVEQNLASITFPIIASLYLERTNDWETVGVQRKIDADRYIKSGYLHQLTFKRSDGSYPPHAGRGPSTWVTAYVVKVFTMAYSLYSGKDPNIINSDEICKSVSFLVKNKQLHDGSFSEDHPVRSHTEMLGGLRSSDSAATLTAFVSIALAEVKNADIDCSYQVDIKSTIDKAVPFLKGQLQKSPSPSPYTKAIVSYALTLLTNGEYDPTNILLAASSDNTFWPGSDSLSSLEATGYALLAMVKMRRLKDAEKIFTYLRDHRHIGGGSGNTQSTMVVLQALSEYLITQSSSVQPNLNVNLRIASRRIPINFNSETNYKIRSFNVGQDEDLEVVATGNGEGTVEVVTYYNQLPEEDAKACGTFDMQVTMEKLKIRATTQLPSLVFTQGQGLELENPPPGIINTFVFSVKVKALGPDAAVSVVLDITIPTGFNVEIRDLERLLNGVDKFIDHYYFEDKLSERSSLIIHMYTVSNTRHQDVSFRMSQHFNVGFLQPSSVTVYEYYKEESQRCKRLYSPPRDQTQITTICRKTNCKCAQDDCCEIKKNDIKDKERETFACKSLHHVFKVKVLNSSVVVYSKYEMEITRVFKLGVESGVLDYASRFFLSHAECSDECQLQINSEYLIMGPESDLWTTDSATDTPMYMLGKDTWVERWPSETECNDAAFKAKCDSLTIATNTLYDEGCRSKK